MIKILKEGHVKHQMTCWQCKCVFEYEAEDVTKRIVWDDHGGHYPAARFYEINCPYCNTTLNVKGAVLKEENKMKRVDD